MKRKSRNDRPARSAESGTRITVRREKRLDGKVSAAAIRRTVRRSLLKRSLRGPCSLDLLLAGEDTVAELNARYRGISRPTDVLSFPAGIVDPETAAFHLGEVIISLPQAARQAAARQVTLESEVLLLAVHGTLHLLGYDHEKAGGKKRMWREQRRILKEVST